MTTATFCINTDFMTKTLAKLADDDDWGASASEEKKALELCKIEYFCWENGSSVMSN